MSNDVKWVLDLFSKTCAPLNAAGRVDIAHDGVREVNAQRGQCELQHASLGARGFFASSARETSRKSHEHVDVYRPFRPETQGKLMKSL